MVDSYRSGKAYSCPLALVYCMAGIPSRRVMHSAVTVRSASHTGHPYATSIKIHSPYGLIYVLPKHRRPALTTSTSDVSSVDMPGKTLLVEPSPADQLDRASMRHLFRLSYSLSCDYLCLLRPVRSNQTYCTRHPVNTAEVFSELFATVKMRNFLM